MAQQMSTRGYPMVHLCKDGRKRMHEVHRLVALAWLGPPPTPKSTVNHIDGAKPNNFARNLEWVSIQRNIAHAIEIGLHGDPRGATNPKAKLTEEQVREIRARPGGYGAIPRIATEFGVAILCISRIRRRVTWTHI